MKTKRMIVVGLTAVFAMTMAGEAMAGGLTGLGAGGAGMRVQSPSIDRGSNGIGGSSIGSNMRVQSQQSMARGVNGYGNAYGIGNGNAIGYGFGNGNGIGSGPPVQSATTRQMTIRPTYPVNVNGYGSGFRQQPTR